MSFLEGANSVDTTKTAFVSPQDYYLYEITQFDNGSEIVNYLDLAVGASSRGVVDNDFLDDYGHALLISEIVAGQLNGVLQTRYDYLDANSIPYTPVDLYDSIYDQLNATERVGLTGAVKALYYSLNSLLVPDTEMTEVEIMTAFESMLDSEIAKIFYLADIYPCLTAISLRWPRLGRQSESDDFDRLAKYRPSVDRRPRLLVRCGRSSIHILHPLS
jgi:hypothetical protein